MRDHLPLALGLLALACLPASAQDARRAITLGDHIAVLDIDILGAVDEAVKQGIADPERLGIGGVPTELVIYPGQFHSPTVPSYQRDHLQRHLDWCNRHLQPASATSAGR